MGKAAPIASSEMTSMDNTASMGNAAELTASVTTETTPSSSDTTTAPTIPTVTVVKAASPPLTAAGSSVCALLKAEIARLEPIIQKNTVVTRTELLGRDRYGRGYYFFNTVPGILVQPVEEVFNHAVTPALVPEAAEVTELRLKSISAYGVSPLEFPASVVVWRLITY
jgi:hypothetical protein